MGCLSEFGLSHRRPATSAAKWALFGFCILVAAASIYLLYHYNDRITKVRKASDEMMDRLSEADPDIEKFIGKDRYPTNDLEKRDQKEMSLFSYSIGFSILPAFCVWASSW